MIPKDEIERQEWLEAYLNKQLRQEEVEYKNQDPIVKVLNTILENNYATQAEIDAIDQQIHAIVEESARFAEQIPWPDESEVLKDVYIDENYPLS